MTSLIKKYEPKKGFFTPKEELLWEALPKESKEYWLNHDQTIFHSPPKAFENDELDHHESNLQHKQKSFNRRVFQLQSIQEEYKHGIYIFFTLSIAFSGLLFYKDGHWLGEGAYAFVMGTGCLLGTLIFILLYRSGEVTLQALFKNSMQPMEQTFLQWKPHYPLLRQLGMDVNGFYSIAHELPYSDSNIEFLELFSIKLPSLCKHQNLYDLIDQLGHS